MNERFIAFLRREAAGYHAPPETPSERLWPAIEAEWRIAVGGSPDAPLEGADTDEGDPGASARELLRAGAADYHVPPVTPREAMWDRIDAAWRRETSADVDAGDGRIDSVESGSREADASGSGRSSDRSLRPLWPVAIAASLLLGVLIGRGIDLWDGGSRLAIGEASDSAPAVGSRDAAPAVTDEAGERDPEPSLQPPESQLLESGGPLATAERGERAVAIRPAGGAEDGAAAGAAADRGPEASVGGMGEATVGGVDLAYRLATERHLARAEMLLTAFRMDRTNEETEPTAGRWASELLGETRLLLDWTGAADQRFRTLLEELELVLVQIVRLRDAEERSWVVDAMERRNMLPRLRSTAAPGPVASAAGT